jgi:hypothetical protein
MAREFQHPTPAASQETRAWWEGCGRHELVLQRCRACGVVQHRPRAVCATCLSGELEHFVAAGRGEVHTFTVTHQNGVPPFRDALPYVLAYVALEEGPRLMTNVVDCEPGAVAIGMPVVVDFADVDTRDLGEAGGVFAVPRFRPA